MVVVGERRTVLEMDRGWGRRGKGRLRCAGLVWRSCASGRASPVVLVVPFRYAGSLRGRLP